MVCKERDWHCRRVIESLLVRALPPGATANELDSSRHESLRTFDLDSGWSTALHRWISNWPSIVFRVPSQLRMAVDHDDMSAETESDIPVTEMAETSDDSASESEPTASGEDE